MMGKLAEYFVFGVAPLLVGLLAIPSLATAEDKTISGEVLYRERIALPPQAVLTVQLVDVSLADAPAKVIGQQKIEPAGQVPAKFAVKFDEAAIRSGMSYALQARITVDDRLWFINDVRHSVEPLTAGPQSMLLKMVSQSEPADEAGIFERDWVAEDIDGGGVIDKAKSTLRIGKDGGVSGRGGCNGYFGSAKIDGNNITFGQIGATQMACEQAMMDQEHKFHDALGRVATYAIADGKLVMADKDGKAILRLAAGS
ncbi:YbaY family lipoprotein [Mesorhizobium sp. CC13]|uniref:YbaY family lipoprotein n=1 Tax=Mesorhizobium sp. CC13 TaxID=3029194 RepID=UPI003265C569